jgi:hypothetical protein
MPYKNFTPNVLPASDVNNYLMNQSVIVFDSVAQRDATLTTPIEGMVTYLKDTNTLWFYNGTSWIQITTSPILSVAAKEGPTSLISAYKNRWAKGFGLGTSLDWSTYDYGIQVKDTGVYEVWATQRSTGADSFIGISINGDRTTLEDRTNGIWSHDHSNVPAGWTKSYYLGYLNASEIISAGSPSGANCVFASDGYAGFLSIKRIA